MVLHERVVGRTRRGKRGQMVGWSNTRRREGVKKAAG